MDSKAASNQAFLLGLKSNVAEELRTVLSAANCQLSSDPGGAEIIFCRWDRAAFAVTRGRFPDVPIVVVSELPDVNSWLDALEAGAADYCAAPFEAIQMRWILDTHLRQLRRAYAAA
jgi:PleD family two-component response regulator